jgi:site-specific DNA recombinase
MVVRIYLRRSKNDEGKQQFSLDVQETGSRDLIGRLGLDAHPVVPYVDDGRAGDDFLTRKGLRDLIAESRTGDVIICRDQSRLGRDAIEVTLAVRELVRDRRCLLYYYATGQQVHFDTAIDQATTFIQGTGHQMELEAIRSRTREGLRSRVRDGRIAGGACYGYTLVRKSDSSGRKYTVAIVNEDQARIVRRIYDGFLVGHGIKAIAHQLNAEGAASPSAGRRGSGSWAPGAVRTVLMNARYRGVYIHGRIKKVRNGGGSLRVKAEPGEMMFIDMPDWRIVPDDVWFAVQERFTSRGPRAPMGRPPARYPLIGIGRCAHCGGAISSARTRVRGGGSERVKVYACGKHHLRGSAVCPVTVHQRMEDVEGALVDYLQTHLLTERALDSVLAEVREQLAAHQPKHDAEVAKLEAALREVRAEQKRLAKAVAMADDVTELVAELRQRSARIQRLEAEIISAKRTPGEVASVFARIEKTAKTVLLDMRTALADPGDRREAFLALFPSGLSFAPTRTPDGMRQVWQISGDADLGVLTGSNREAFPLLGGAHDFDLNSENHSDVDRGSKRVATPTGFEPVLPA